MWFTPSQVGHLRSVHRPAQEKVSKGLGAGILLSVHIHTGISIAAALEPLQQGAVASKARPQSVTYAVHRSFQTTMLVVKVIGSALNLQHIGVSACMP